MCHGAKIIQHRLCTNIRGMAINPLIGILFYTRRIPIVGWMTISDLLLTMAYVGKDGKILPNYVLIRFFKAVERLWSNTYHIFRGWTSVNPGLLKLARIYHLVMTNIAMENPKNIWRFIAGKIIYFYGPSIPWQTVSHNQRVKSINITLIYH